MSEANDNLSDREIIRRFNAGETSVFAELVRRHSGRAYQIAYGVLGSREDAEEVSQDVFVRIYRSLSRFRGESEFTTWLYRIAMNLARNKYRWNKSRGAKRSLSLEESRENESQGGLGIQLPSNDPSPDREVGLAEFRKNVMAEMDKLPPLYREALVLRNVEEMSYEDIAAVLDCKLGTIKSRIARAREELRKRLEQ